MIFGIKMLLEFSHAKISLKRKSQLPTRKREKSSFGR